MAKFVIAASSKWANYTAAMLARSSLCKAPQAKANIFAIPDPVLITERSHWGRSTQNLVGNLTRLTGLKVLIVAMNGLTFEPATPQGLMMSTLF